MGTTPYFTNIEDVIERELDTAQANIIVAMAWLTSPKLFQALVNAAKRGVLVRIAIQDDYINRSSSLIIKKLAAANGHCYWITKSKGHFHHKFCVIDDNIVITGSYNWTSGARLHNDENITVTDGDSKLAAEYSQAFEESLKKYGYVSRDSLLSSLPLEQTQVVNAELILPPEIEELEFLRTERNQRIKQSTFRSSMGVWIMIGTVVAWLSIGAIIRAGFLSTKTENTTLSAITSQPPPANIVSKTIFKTQSNSDRLVKDIQQQLNRLGFDTGHPNGILNAKTSAAIIAFQSSHQMIKDGNVSYNLLAILINTPKVVRPRPRIQQPIEIVTKPECTFKTVMSDDDYRLCGLNPPE